MKCVADAMLRQSGCSNILCYVCYVQALLYLKGLDKYVEPREPLLPALGVLILCS